MKSRPRKITIAAAIIAGAFGAALAQTSRGRQQSSIPPPGTASVRLEDWGRIRTVVSPILGWKVGVACDRFQNLTFSEAAAKADAIGVAHVQGSPRQMLSPEIPKRLDHNLAPGEIAAVGDRLRALNLRMPVYAVPRIGPDENSARKLFEFARSLGVETIASSPDPELLPLLDRLAGEFEIQVALCNRTRQETPAYWNPENLLRELENRSTRIGACVDTGHWIREGIDPLKSLAPLKDRLLVLKLPESGGMADPASFYRELRRLGTRPSLIVVDAAGAPDTSASLERSLKEFEEAVRPVLAETVAEMARNAAIRGPERLTAEEKEKILAALPRQGFARPARPRRLLVMDLQIAYGGHRSIPAQNFALEQMGKLTGAYEAVFSNDLANLKYDRIKQFDAVFLNNTVGMLFVDPEVRDGLSRFVREGGGLAGNHGTSHASMDWPEFGEMIGAWRGVHRDATERVTVKIDDPESPLNAPFGGKEFVYQDEFFRFPVGPYSRETLRVLLSIDVAKTDMNQGRPCPQPCNRPDHDYAISWIRSYGKGRVFFCTLGHNPTLFTTPALAAHFLAGIQFILGDLKADTTPSAKLARRQSIQTGDTLRGASAR